MPNCFHLIPKGGDKPEPLAQIDNKMCEHFGVVPHDRFYLRWWFDTIARKLAMGESFEEIRVKMVELDQQFPDEKDEGEPTHAQICDWLSENYVSDSWVEVVSERHSCPSYASGCKR